MLVCPFGGTLCHPVPPLRKVWRHLSAEGTYEGKRGKRKKRKQGGRRGKREGAVVAPLETMKGYGEGSKAQEGKQGMDSTQVPWPHAYSAKRSLTQDISDSYISYVNLSPLDKLKTLRALRDQCFSQPLFCATMSHKRRQMWHNQNLTSKFLRGCEFWQNQPHQDNFASSLLPAYHICLL